MQLTVHTGPLTMRNIDTAGGRPYIDHQQAVYDIWFATNTIRGRRQFLRWTQAIWGGAGDEGESLSKFCKVTGFTVAAAKGLHVNKGHYSIII